MTALGILHAVGVSFGLGMIYFLAAIPVGSAMGLPIWVAALLAWAGYVAIAGVMVAVGAPVRTWLTTKFRIDLHPNPKKLFWRVWSRGGLAGLSLLAPVTCGPYVAVLLALSLGDDPRRSLAWVAVGAIPWAVGFAFLTGFGFSFLPTGSA